MQLRETKYLFAFRYQLYFPELLLRGINIMKIPNESDFNQAMIGSMNSIKVCWKEINQRWSYFLYHAFNGFTTVS